MSGNGKQTEPSLRIQNHEHGTEHSLECKIQHLRKQVWEPGSFSHAKLFLFQEIPSGVAESIRVTFSFFFSIQKHVLSGYCGPGIVLGTGIDPVSKLDLVTACLGEDMGIG